jgi:GT2 family glycosyltransferase
MREPTSPPAAGDRSESGLQIDHASWLSRDVLLVAGRIPAGATSVQASTVINGSRVQLESRFAEFEARASDGGSDRRYCLLAIFAPVPDGGSRFEGELEVNVDGEGVTFVVGEEENAVTPLDTLVRRGLAPLDRTGRGRALQFLATVAGERPDSGRLKTSETLSNIRDALRERLPSAVEQAGLRGVYVDSLLAVDETAFYVVGWLYDKDAEVVRLTAVSPEGARAELFEQLFRYPRQDVSLSADERDGVADKPGFVCFFELDAPSLLRDGWVIEMKNADGVSVEAPMPPAIVALNTVRDAILNDPDAESVRVDELLENHVFPAVTRLQKRVEESIEVESVTQYGTPPEGPTISVIVPLYVRVDLIEQQLAEFANDPEFHRTDLVYVLDSPEQKEELLFLAGRLFPIYRVPFRVAALKRNVGFAGACNAGASVATGRLLLFMNSDVLPAQPGWLEAMRAFYDGTPNVGAVTPKLLYEDDSIQHAGMYLYQPPGTSGWQDAHYYKGLRRDFPAANVTRPVPGLSAACMLVDRELFESIGGFRGIFVRGDYEDFDLCLRLREAGRENWYLASVELYHLEALSYVISDLRFGPNRYNQWVHTHLWRDRIEELMQDERFRVGADVGAA